MGNHWSMQACGARVFGKKTKSKSSGCQSEIATFEKAEDCPSLLSAHTASYTAAGAALSQLLNLLVLRVYLKAHSDNARL